MSFPLVPGVKVETRQRIDLTAVMPTFPYFAWALSLTFVLPPVATDNGAGFMYGRRHDDAVGAKSEAAIFRRRGVYRNKFIASVTLGMSWFPPRSNGQLTPVTLLAWQVRWVLATPKIGTDLVV